MGVGSDVTSVVEAIKRWASQPDLLERHKRNARRALEERFTRSQALMQYIEVWSLLGWAMMAVKGDATARRWE
jgi:glycosyltransferase involved in cell wall biosynthesis